MATHPLATYQTDKATLSLYSQESIQAFLEHLQSDFTVASKPSVQPLLTVFKCFPQVTDAMMTYFDECLKCTDIKLRLSPTILLGVLSELLILTLIKTCGDYLEDPNTITCYGQKRGSTKIDYTNTLVDKVKCKIQEGRALTDEERNCFGQINSIVSHMFDTKRLNRDEYVHPKPENPLPDPPTEAEILIHVDAFNTYSKAVLVLVDIIKKL